MYFPSWPTKNTLAASVNRSGEPRSASSARHISMPATSAASTAVSDPASSGQESLEKPSDTSAHRSATAQAPKPRAATRKPYRSSLLRVIGASHGACTSSGGCGSAAPKGRRAVLVATHR
jgi:hypothetical protein